MLYPTMAPVSPHAAPYGSSLRTWVAMPPSYPQCQEIGDFPANQGIRFWKAL